jgi:membrane fusion protein, multidrug efflux system
MRFRIFLVAIIVIIIIVAAIAFDYVYRSLVDTAMKKRKPPPQYVSTVVAKEETWQPRLQSIGSLQAINGVTVTTEVSGIIVQLGFKSGEIVKQGQYLIQLDDSLDVQNLKNNQAELTLTQLDFNRKEKLYRTAAISKSQYDDALAKLRQAKAQVNKSLVEISHKRIKAPFDGKLGIREVDLGQYLNPGDAIVPLQSLNPMYVNFSLPQRNLTQVYLGQKFTLSIDSFPNQKFEGKVTAINALVTSSTRNIKVQGTLPNPKMILYPGVFADVFLFLPEEKKVVTVPQTAVDYSLYGDIVYVVEPTKEKDKDGEKIYKIKQHVVKTGLKVGDKVQIISGIKVGETVVSSGQLKLVNNMEVKINNKVNMTLPKPSQLEGGR